MFISLTVGYLQLPNNVFVVRFITVCVYIALLQQLFKYLNLIFDPKLFIIILKVY